MKGKSKRIVSGFLSALTIISSIMQPVTTYAAEAEPAAYEAEYPDMEKVKGALAEDEIVTAEDYEVEAGTGFDVKSDFSGMKIHPEKVKVTYHEAKNQNGQAFDGNKADTYHAVYFVEPVSGHPSYHVQRNIVVREPSAEIHKEKNAQDSDGNDQTGGEDAEEGETDSHKKKLSETELNQALEALKGQDTYDEESGLKLLDVMEQFKNHMIAGNVDLLALEEGETVTFTAYNPKMLRSSQVEVSSGGWYYYADYGLGSYLTCPFTVKFGSVTATAYCIQPSKPGPGSGVYEITKLGDGKELSKVCYYGTNASGEDCFFDKKYPDFSAGKRFVVTHLAASYAEGSEDAFYGANDTGIALAKELYSYAVSQPEIPDAAMAFSDDKVTAYVDGNIQRTKEVTFQADSRQSITMKLPKGVKFHNVSTGKISNAGADVVVKGGTTFFLSAPLTQTEDVGQNWSAKMKGSITKDYSAYKITTGSDTQNLALVFGEGIEEETTASFQVTWLELAKVQVVKVDSEKEDAKLSGAVFGIYKDKNCTQLIKEMPKTDKNGTASVEIVKTQDTVYLKEITAPTGYRINTSAYNVKLVANQSTSVTVPDKEQLGELTVYKEGQVLTGADLSEKGIVFRYEKRRQKGAVYSVYAGEDIMTAYGAQVYKKGELVKEHLVTGDNGAAVLKNLHLGTYIVKEMQAPENFYNAKEEKTVTLSYAGQNAEAVFSETTFINDRQKAKVSVVKKDKDTEKPLDGGIFGLYAGNDIVNADGIVVVKKGSLIEKAVTGEDGTAIFTADLPIGNSYYVKEEQAPSGYQRNKEDIYSFKFSYTNDSEADVSFSHTFVNERVTAKIFLKKKDAETNKAEPQGDATLEKAVYGLYAREDIVHPDGATGVIYKAGDNEKYVEQVTTYPTTIVHKSYFTDADGYLILPQNLKIGHYRIEEVTAPDGYTINKNYAEIKVDSDTLYQIEPVSGDAIIEVVYENHPVKGELTVVKKGEVLKDYGKDFKYEMENLAGAVFAIYAAEDIYTADFQKDDAGNRILEYAKDTLVAELTTDETGSATIKNLPLGNYRVVEKTAPDGFVHNKAEQNVQFVYVDQDTPAVVESVEFINERQKVEISVEKQDAENGSTIAGAEFGLYAKEDIKAGGKVIVKADEQLCTAVTGEDGTAIFEQNLPFGSYYIKELQAPDGFVSSDEIIEVTVSYQGQDVEVVRLKEIFKNQPTTVEFRKSDLTTGVELDGATLTVLDKDGNEIDKWTSVKGEPHIIKRLHVGETYILREEFAPYGYLKAEEVEFTITDTAEIQKVEMKDDVPIGRIIINKKGEFLSEVSWNDMVAGAMDSIWGYVTGSLKDVTFEIYAREDIKAADGESDDYYKKDELVATIKTDELGIARTDDLPLGKYYVVEKETADGFVLDGEPRDIDLTYRDQDTPVVTFDSEWQNSRQKAKVIVTKKEKDSDRVLEGGVFALCAKEDIKNTDGDVLVKADTIMEQKATDKDGKIFFTADLPVGGSFYVKEVKAPAGFVTTEEVKEFTFEYAGADVPEVTFEHTFENEATIFEITKSDLTTGEELPGAKLEVTDQDGTVVDEWTSGTEPHIIKELEVGKEYTLTETLPADGYVTAESITFTVENTAEVQKVEMKDDVTKVEISKTDISGKELPGAKMTVLDKDGNAVESWTSTDKPHYMEKLPIGDYILREETAPEGYLIAEDVEFSVKDTGEIQKVSMKDEKKPSETPQTPQEPSKPTDTPKTGDDSNIRLWLLLAGLALCGTGGSLFLLKKKK